MYQLVHIIQQYHHHLQHGIHKLHVIQNQHQNLILHFDAYNTPMNYGTDIVTSTLTAVLIYISIYIYIFIYQKNNIIITQENIQFVLHNLHH